MVFFNAPYMYECTKEEKINNYVLTNRNSFRSLHEFCALHSPLCVLYVPHPLIGIALRSSTQDGLPTGKRWPDSTYVTQ